MISKTRSRRLTKREGRLRCVAHLRYVAGLPCDFCGFAGPNQAHHLLCAPVPKARGLKPGDNWVVSACAGRLDRLGCHERIHKEGSERGLMPKDDCQVLAMARWSASIVAGRYRAPDGAPGDDGALVRLCAGDAMEDAA